MADRPIDPPPLPNFPVPLVCPTCAHPLAETPCSCGSGIRLSWEHGLPRTLFGQRYWGETSSEKMAQILALSERMHWRQALATAVPGEAVEAHLKAPIGPDFVYAIPWDDISTVLDIGAGMGFMTTALAARHGKPVVALEAVPERARFIQARARQDGLSIHPLIGSATAMPFPPGSFDLITLNGVFEYIGLWVEGDPEAAQRAFLRKCLDLLTPNGYLYIGIETRFGFYSFAGGRDHSGLKFTSLMPRRMADWYCRLRSSRFYGSEHEVRSYRTYTYTPKQYRTMVAEAGFGTVLVQGVYSGYNLQRALYDMEAPAARTEALERMFPATTWKGQLRRALTDRRWLYRLLEDEVVVFARKPTQTTPLVWDGIATGGPVAQLNTDDKTMAVCFAGNQPTSIAESAKTAATAPRLEAAFGHLETLERLYGAEVPSWPIRWPRPVERLRYHGRTFYRYEYARGRGFRIMLLPAQYDPDIAIPLFRRMIAEYPAFCDRISARWPAGSVSRAWAPAAEFADFPGLAARVARAAEHAEKAGWPLRVTHGDFTPGNLVLDPGGRVYLLDWEHLLTSAPWAVDLYRFYVDVLLETEGLASAQVARVRDAVTEALHRTLTLAGFGPADFDHIESLFLGQQAANGKLGGPLLTAWADGRIALGAPGPRSLQR